MAVDESSKDVLERLQSTNAGTEGDQRFFGKGFKRRS